MKFLDRLKRHVTTGFKTPHHLRSIVAILIVAGMLMNLSALSAFAATSTPFATAVTLPRSGLVLPGTAIDPATGQPVRHYWTGDHVQGLCRVDPFPGAPGGNAINPNTCILLLFGQQIKPGQLAYDPTRQFVYAPDLSARSIGVFRLHYLPNGDFGQGSADLLNLALVAQGCGLDGTAPDTVQLGPDGNLYVGFKQTGNVLRVIHPERSSIPCSDVQTIGQSADGKTTFALGFIGNNLWGTDGLGTYLIQNATACDTVANKFTPCRGVSILASQVAKPVALTTDQVYPQTNGSQVFLGNATQVFRVDPISGSPNVYATGFSFVSALSVDMTNSAQPILYVGDDPADGVPFFQGRLWQVTTAPPPPAAPGAPTGVTATAGDAQATVNWTPGSIGSQPTTSYTVHTLTAAGGVTATPDIVVTAPTGSTIVPTTATVTGLSNGTSYEFTVQATNSVGTSRASAPSNVVTPQPPTVPGAPTGVSAVAGNAQATVGWTAPASDGGSSIISYTVAALVNGLPVGATATAPSNATGVIVTGLTDGTSYSFVVHATNAVGDGPDSAPSNSVTPVPPSSDLGVAVSGPATGQVGADATYSLVVTNAGPSSAPSVILTANLPPTGASVVSTTTAQGACSLAGSTLTCNLGSVAAGASATVAITLSPSASGTLTVSAQVVANDATGAPLGDPNPANNSGSISTTVVAAPTSTTDIQVSGSSNNGGPAVGSNIAYTWQIKNAGNQAANALSFTDNLPATLTFRAVSTSLGTCTGPVAGSAGGAVSCNLSGLPAGQAMVVTVNVSVPTAGTIINSGSATFAGTDTNLANNTASVTIQVR